MIFWQLSKVSWQYQLLRSNKVKKIVVTSYEEDRTPTEGFNLTQEYQAMMEKN
jgi:hypothetical protein